MTGPQITILFRERQEHEEIALLLEVIAGEIRHGHESGEETHATWTMLPAGRDDTSPSWLTTTTDMRTP